MVFLIRLSFSNLECPILLEDAMTTLSHLPENRFPFAHTYSIIARDPETGEMGAAVQSHWFSVGSVVPWAQAGIGVVATQAMADVSYGPQGLSAMAGNPDVNCVLRTLLAADENHQLRQVAMLHVSGNVAAYTGSRCIAEAGHVTGYQYSVQANMMLKNTVWDAMAKAYENSRGDLADRMMTALEAAQAEDGDIRGMQSAAMVIVSGNVTDQPWKEKSLELRVEDHPAPLAELKRLIQVHKAYDQMNEGDRLISEGKTEEAFEAYNAAALMAPDMDELPFWQATTMADLGKLDQALPIFKKVFAKNHNWALLLQRLPKAGLFSSDPELMKKILAEAPKAQSSQH
jgi:uncharacterized Ntn-hydrolase superfamily protein